MLAVQEGHRRFREPPLLQNGDRIRSDEFLRRYEAMPEVKKAELIEGIVYMASPVSAETHGELDGLIHTWLGTYAAHTPGVRFSQTQRSFSTPTTRRNLMLASVLRPARVAGSSSRSTFMARPS